MTGQKGFYSSYKFSRMVGVDSQCLRKWDATGILKPHHTTSMGHRYYNDEQLKDALKIVGKTTADIVSAKVPSDMELLIKQLTAENQAYHKKIMYNEARIRKLEMECMRKKIRDEVEAENMFYKEKYEQMRSIVGTL